MKQVGRSVFLNVVFAGLLSAAMFQAAWSTAHASNTPKPVLVNTCLITGKFAQLVDFNTLWVFLHR